MANQNLEVFIATFNNETEAKSSLQDFRAMDKEGSIEIIDAAVVVHDSEGKVTFEEPGDPSGRKLAKRGAIAGGLVGLIFPPSIIAGAVVAGGAGGIWGKLRDKGFKDKDLKEVGNDLPPGTSAIIVVAEDKVLERLQTGLQGYQKVSRHLLGPDASAALLAEISTETA